MVAGLFAAEHLASFNIWTESERYSFMRSLSWSKLSCQSPSLFCWVPSAKSRLDHGHISVNSFTMAVDFCRGSLPSRDVVSSPPSVCYQYISSTGRFNLQPLETRCSYYLLAEHLTWRYPHSSVSDFVSLKIGVNGSSSNIRIIIVIITIV